MSALQVLWNARLGWPSRRPAEVEPELGAVVAGERWWWQAAEPVDKALEQACAVLGLGGEPQPSWVAEAARFTKRFTKREHGRPLTGSANILVLISG